jgi:hypothetical protein
MMMQTGVSWFRTKPESGRCDNSHEICGNYIHESRSLWPRGLRHEPSSPAQTLRSWVRIQLEARMTVCGFILCLCCPVCVQVAVFRRADPPSKGFY